MESTQTSSQSEAKNRASSGLDSRQRRLAHPVVFGSRTLGNWQLTELAGEGQFSRVHFARPLDDVSAMSVADDETPPSDYAIKELRPEYSTDAAAAARFRQEAVIGISVEHANVATVLSAHFDGEPSYFVMPRLHGMTLRQRLTATGKVEIPCALWIARQIANGLSAVHQAGWLHADVKPENLMLGPDGHVTVCDFGLAVTTHENSNNDVRGTYEYAAPESFTSKHGLCTASDVYSLGVVLYEMLTGRRPFDGVPASLVESHVNRVPVSVRDFSKQIPKELAQLVSRMLAKQPSRRPVGGDELQDQLARLEVQLFAQRVA